jgi:hypothetical protein
MVDFLQRRAPRLEGGLSGKKKREAAKENNKSRDQFVLRGTFYQHHYHHQFFSQFIITNAIRRHTDFRPSPLRGTPGGYLRRMSSQ